MRRDGQRVFGHLVSDKEEEEQKSWLEVAADRLRAAPVSVTWDDVPQPLTDGFGSTWPVQCYFCREVLYRWKKSPSLYELLPPDEDATLRGSARCNFSPSAFHSIGSLGQRGPQPARSRHYKRR
jgi:hypothetical protein